MVSNVFSQFPFNGVQSVYQFENGSLLIDGANGNNFTQTGNTLVEVNDRFGGTPTSAIDINNDHLTAGDINFGGNNLAFTITWSFWLKTTTDSPDVKTIIDDSTRNTVVGFDSDDVGYYIFLRNGQVALSSRYYEANFVTPRRPKGYGHIHPTNIADGDWHHIVVTFNPNFVSGVQRVRSKIYIDGVANAKSAIEIPIETSPNTNGNITIANSRNNHLPLANRYTDEIDDIFAYNRELTVAEIDQIKDFNNYCFKPSSSIISSDNITQTSADINLTATSGNYDIAYHKQNEAFANAQILTNITTGPVALTNLEVFTDYNVYIREQCSVTTSWSDPISFKTTRPIGRIYVDQNATGNNNGLDWANAFNHLYDALAITANNEEIWIAAGTYTPSPGSRANRLRVEQNDLKLYGGFNGTETQLSDRVFGMNETILTGDFNADDTGTASFGNSSFADNAHTIVNIIGNNAILDQLTITGANANGSVASTRRGGAVAIEGSLTINNCKITNNIAVNGGAGISFITTGTKNLSVTNCEISDNYSRYGAGAYITSSNNSSCNITFANCLFMKNTSTDNGTEKGIAGSALWIRALSSGASYTTTISGCTFVANTDIGTDNRVNNFNRIPVGLSQASTGTHTVNFSNNILWDNETVNGITSKSISSIYENDPTWTFKQNIAEDNFFGISSTDQTNTSNNDPLFTNAALSDYSLSNGSPAIDIGDNTEVIGTSDLANNNRIANAIVDLGAFEANSQSTLSHQVFTEEKLLQINIYPNPVANYLTIESKKTITQVLLISLSGVSEKMKLSDDTVDLSTKNTGIYFLEISFEDQTKVIKKIMKK